MCEEKAADRFFDSGEHLVAKQYSPSSGTLDAAWQSTPGFKGRSAEEVHISDRARSRFLPTLSLHLIQGCAIPVSIPRPQDIGHCTELSPPVMDCGFLPDRIDL